MLNSLLVFRHASLPRLLNLLVAAISPEDVEWLFKEGKGAFLAEVMNFPGVIAGDKNTSR